ncbi:lysophospholipid acyltransferase family protein [Brevundimonas sp. 2R-24]|uniref:Lysophospholipid acyltransferase family protein n=1 Tax=Peiella sedimenti TaxID=3061083 RepID=A0ABT8SJR8_9CAUL|nr:lysophospholipid acyltransferase family protein [Caulobacteraceae bacterium XZ-24]
MARPLRNPIMQGLLSGLLTAWLRLCLSTMRWTREGQDQAEAVWAAGGGVVVCFWHSRVSLAPGCWPLDRAQPPRVLISLSPDGEFIARAVGRLGFPAIRGSSAKKTALDKAKGGAAALRDALRWIRSGGGIAITPDGPRGPAETMAEGAVVLAQAAGAPILLVGLASEPAFRLKTWDTALVPRPFARGGMVWKRLDPPARGVDLEALAKDWAAELSALTRRAEALCGARRSGVRAP